ncbi:MAG: cytochrome P450 [Deltaproteobacteria bacterium]|nr:cytochrome P450 [Deltaproteobacteria bacterium]MBW2387405.1 cytochrome P450 [Deltaproteobacteria bacterium]MBW2723041.1 cytochrome P450 [Deltaproteobacteria bacterium]
MSEPEVTLEQILGAGPMARIPSPHALYAKLRRETPVVSLSGPLDSVDPADGPGSVMITRYDDVRRVLKSENSFSSGVVNRTMGLVMGPTIVGMDGPEHLKHRSLVTPSLAPRALRGDFPAMVERISHEVIDKFADKFTDKGSADIRAEFTFSYPLTVFVQILGLPEEDSDMFHKWGIDLTLVAHDPPKGLAASKKMLDYLTPIVEAKRAEPSGDLISKLATAEVDGERLSDFEVVSFLRLLVLAGAETTYHLMGSCLFALLRDPALMQRVREDRSLIPELMQEVLRWESPIATVIREASEDTQIGEVEIPKGTNVLCHIGSANRDGDRFPNPDLLDIDREDKEHLAFGFGKHYCAGSRFALLEGEVGINAILDRLKNLAPQAGEEFDIIGFSFRGPDRLPVTFDVS